MNIIMVLMDSLNFHCLEPYGALHVATPNLARFAERAVTFDQHFIASAPCMPARRDLLTGRQEFLWRGWGHIEPWDRHLAVDAERLGYVTQMVTDHYHYWENAAHGYFEPFHGVEFVRGHELDLWDTTPLCETPEWVRSIDRYRPKHWRRPEGWGSLYFGNARNYLEDESSFPCAQVMQNAASWLSRNHTHPRFLLWAEAFDPHEPHWLPEPYRTMYSPDGRDHPEFTCWPPYQNHVETRKFLAQTSEEEIAWIRAQYYGKVTMVDAWFGTLLDRMDALNLWENTTVVVTTDHGHDLCYDRTALYPYGKGYPHPESHARIPLMIAHPQAKPGRRISALTSAVDVNATLRDAMGDPAVDGPDGRSLMPLVMGETTTHRDEVLYGDFGTGVCLSTPEWTLAQGCRADRPLYWYSTTAMHVSPTMEAGRFIPGIDVPQWRVPVTGADLPSYLWQREPFVLTPESRVNHYPDVTAAMRIRLRSTMCHAAPSEQLVRLGLEGAGNT